MATAVLIGTVFITQRLWADPPEERMLDCGPNSLFILLELLGYKADLVAINHSLPPRHPEGYSMPELQNSALTFGVPLRGVRFDKREVPLSLPAIAFVHGAGEGHFIVLRPVGVTGKMVQAIDPPSAPVVTDYDRLLSASVWTGRLLVPQSRGDRLICWSWIAMPFVCLLVLVRLVLRRIKKVV